MGMGDEFLDMINIHRMYFWYITDAIDKCSTFSYIFPFFFGSHLVSPTVPLQKKSQKHFPKRGTPQGQVLPPPRPALRMLRDFAVVPCGDFGHGPWLVRLC